MEDGVVYFIKADLSEINEDFSFHRTKVGKSKKPRSRKDTLSTGSPVDLIHIRSIVHPKYSRYEKYVHCAFQFYKVRDKKEWFDLPHEIFEEIERGTDRDLDILFEKLCGLSFEDYCRIIPLGY